MTSLRLAAIIGLLAIAGGALAQSEFEPGPQWEKDRALRAACWHGDEELVPKLLDQGADVNGRDGNGRTPLYLTVANSYNTLGDTVQSQVEKRHARVVAMLIDRGAEMDGPDYVGITPLMVAASHGQLVLFKLLLRRGADDKRRDRYGRTALTWATPHGRQHGAVPLLVERGAKEEFLDALALEDFDLAWKLLREGGRTARLGPYDDTPLMIAAEYGRKDFVRELLSRGAPVNARDEQGLTALHLAIVGRVEQSYPGGRFWRNDARTERAHIVEMLLTAGARLGSRGLS